MKSTSSISMISVKALLCLVLVFGLFSYPPSAAHSMSGMHENHTHSISAHIDSAHQSDAASDALDILHAKCGAVVNSVDTGHADQCCSGMCVSVVLTYDVGVSAQMSKSTTYRRLVTQNNSVDSSGFLRPPQILI